MSKYFNNDTTLLNTIKELTEKLNKKERELVVANNRFHALFEHSPIGLMITVNRHITFANKRMHELAGYNDPELIGQSTRILYDSEKEYDAVGKRIHECVEFTEPIKLKMKTGGTTTCMLKYTKCDNENYVSVYIEAGV